jgi:hypothetical protein
MHSSPLDLAKSYYYSNFAIKSHIGAPKTLLILLNPILAYSYLSINLGYIGSPNDLDDSRLR